MTTTTTITTLLCSDDETLQNLDSFKQTKLDRRKRDTLNENKTELSKQDKPKNSDQKSSETHSSSSSSLPAPPSSLEVLDESETNDDVQRRTRQLRPSLLSNSPWKSSPDVSYRTFQDFSSSGGGGTQLKNFNFPTATAGLLYKSDGRFYPTNPLKSSSGTDFKPVISTYSGNSGDRSKYFQSYHPPSSDLSLIDRDKQSAAPKYKQSSKIAGHTSSSLFPLVFSADVRPSASKDKHFSEQSSADAHQDNNYSYFLFGKSANAANSDAKKKTESKNFNYQASNSQTSSQKKPFVSYGGFFNNNQDAFQNKPDIKQSFSVTKPDTAVSFTPIKTASIPKSSSHLQQQPALAKNQSYIAYKPAKTTIDDKLYRTTTPSYEFSQHFVSSTPKLYLSYSTPNQIFSFDKFIANIREGIRSSSEKDTLGYHDNNGRLNTSSPSLNSNYVKKNNNNNNLAANFVYTATSTAKPPTTTTEQDEYYYDDEEEEPTPPVVKKPPPAIKINSNYQIGSPPLKSHHSSVGSTLSRPSIQSNLANTDDYYYDYSEYDYDEEEILPPPLNKSKYTPMTETMAPRPLNVTTLRPFYVSGRTFTTSAPPLSTESLIPSIIKFPADVFQSIPSFNSQKSKTSKNELKTTTSKTPTTSKYRTTPKSNAKTTEKPTTTKKKTYTSRPDRGNSRFKTSTKRPDRTRLDIDDKLYNRYFLNAKKKT